MSVHERTLSTVSVHDRKTGGYEVRWTEGKRQRSKTFHRRRDAERFDARVKQAKELGQVGMLAAGRTTLRDFVEEQWWPQAQRDLARHTQEAYETTWDLHIEPVLGDHRLAQITPMVVDEYRALLEDQGTGVATIRKALAVLSAALARAVIWGLIPINPVAAVRKPYVPPGQRKPVPPAQVEAMRALLLADRRGADAVLIATLAYSGLRPEEALALRWADIGEQTIDVTRAVAFGEHKPTKTKHPRHVTLLAPLREDLDAYRDLTNGRGLVWPRRSDGALWADYDYRNWRRRIYQPTAAAAGVDDRRPYTLRSSFASLLIAEGRSIVEVAQQCGHSVEMCGRHYARLFAEYAGRRIDPEHEIREARGGNYLRKFFADDLPITTARALNSRL